MRLGGTAARLCARRPTVPNPHLKLDFARHMPRAYVDKVKRAVPDRVYQNRFGAPPLYRWHFRHKTRPTDYVDTGMRPWEPDARSINMSADRLRAQRPQRAFEHPDYPSVEPIPPEEWVFFVGDMVRVMVGPDSGKDGYVKAVIKSRNSVYVAGLHMRYVYKDDSESLGVRGSYVAEEQPLDVSRGQVQLLDPEDRLPTDAQWRLVDAADELVKAGEHRQQWARISQLTGHVIPVPAAAARTYQYVLPEEYPESDKDTRAADVMERTYKPSLRTFEEEIMQDMDIKEDRTHGVTYWY